MKLEPTWIAVVTAWAAFTLTFVLIARRSNSSEQRRDSSSLRGLALQGAGLLAAMVAPREPGSPLVPVPEAYADLTRTSINVLAVLLAFGSVLLAAAALRALGRNWAYSARIIEGHKLVRSGPYSFVRHPIYTAMLFLSVSTALTYSRWEAVMATVALSAWGIRIRTRSEERLMLETFGHEFTRYAAAVPAIIPGLRLGRRAPSSELTEGS